VVLPGELVVHGHQHVVAPAPVRDRALVVTSAHPDQRLHQPVPLRRAADPTIQDLVELGAAVAHPASHHRPVQTGRLLQLAQPGTELRNRALAFFPCHGRPLPLGSPMLYDIKTVIHQ